MSKMLTNKRVAHSGAQPDIMAVSSTVRFRRLAKELPNRQDVVLEIGCSTGEATRRLIGSAARVFAVDSSKELTAQLQTDLANESNVTVVCEDGRNVAALMTLVSNPDLIFIDIGGDARLEAIALQLRLCLLAFTPRLIVIRNFEYAWVSSLTLEAQVPDEPGLVAGKFKQASDKALENLLEVSHSSNVENRMFAVRKLKAFSSIRAQQRLREMVHDEDDRVRVLCRLDPKK